MSSRAPVSRTWIAWVIANALGELVGLGAVFGAGFAAVGLAGSPRTAAGVLAFAGLTVALGALEGSVVGWAQWRVLRRLLPRVTAASWIGATIAGAVVAWLLGMIPSTVGHVQSASPSTPPPAKPPAWTVTLLAVGMGVVGGLVLSFAQWRVLRRYGPAALWLAANAAAWALGMPAIFWLVGATVGEGVTPVTAALFVLGLGGAGAIVGAVHGWVLVSRLAPRWQGDPGLLAARPLPPP